MNIFPFHEEFGNQNCVSVMEFLFPTKCFAIYDGGLCPAKESTIYSDLASVVACERGLGG
jgi:hypothetical protein